MKHLLFLLLIIIYPAFTFSQGFVIHGSVDGLQTGSVSLDYRSASGEDTTVKGEITDGKFTLRGKVAEPEAVRFSISQGWTYNTSFFLENTNIEMHLVKDAGEKTIITGSASNVIYEKLKPGLSDFFDHARENATAHQQDAASHNPRTLQSADSLWSAQQRQWLRSIRSYIVSNPNNYAALYFIQSMMFRPGEYDTMHAVYMQLSPAVRNGWAAKKFLVEFDHVYRTLPGHSAPDVKGNDTLGRTVTLSSYKGKVILLDFWASFCGPCRQENRRMMAFYQKYHDAGFEIVSFSLDDQRQRWVQAILTDGMIWPQASELRGGASATAGVYDITDLPRNVLIDKSGKVYAKDLHGDSLTEAVEKLLANKK
ncbi:MAG: hypothetical protein JWO03_1479 [Bacteroidetes bacterium]|nr:hypothetical protein [Bacteroidota bacterium]